ncbi:MAG: hypothetical protein ACREMB_08065 [Candidatus Rokuibacteriota bacterium]
MTFRYRQAQTDDTRPLRDGLIAEEVAEVYAELVAHGATGEVETVLYHLLSCPPCCSTSWSGRSGPSRRRRRG